MSPLRRCLLLALTLVACANDPLYQACGPGNPCQSDTNLCLSNTITSGASSRTVRFCSKRCTAAAAQSAECPGSGTCMRLNGGDLVCLPRCTAATDCLFPNAACAVTSDSLGQRVCTVAL